MEHGHGSNKQATASCSLVAGANEEIGGKMMGELGKSELAVQVADDDSTQLAKLSQVLEIGIIFHSVIIGVTMGMSQNQCTIRPLVAALAFHQIFEGVGLGGCIAQDLASGQWPTCASCLQLLLQWG